MEGANILTTTDPAVLPSTTTTTTAPTIASVDSGPVLAYAKLEGQEYCYYIRTLQVTLGRQVAKPSTVDIPLGNARSVSRHHARLFYNFATQRFELMVFGKNGAFVNERFVEKGVSVPLENRTKIKIGDTTFLFLLPRIKGIEHQQQQQRPSTRTTPEPTASQHEKDDRADGDNLSNKDIKPPFSYATLIAQAINSTQDKRMALHEIYNYITNHYPYYQMAQNGWQNSIRHNLSLNKAFVKVPRSDTEPGKGAFWTIDPKADMEFLFGAANSNGNGGSSNHNKRANSAISASEASDKPFEEATATVVTASLSNSSSTTPERKRAKKEHRSSSLSSSSDTASAVTIAEVPTSTAVVEEPAAAAAAAAAATVAPPPPTPQQAQQAPLAAAGTSQAQIQLQLQATIRQHLLDPVRNPLPPSIAQLLPQAIAQLPPHLAMQFSSTLQSALRAHQQTSQDPSTTAVPGSVPTSDSVTTSTTADPAVSNTTSLASSSPSSQQQPPSNP